jgi:hypothetical protein
MEYNHAKYRLFLLMCLLFRNETRETPPNYNKGSLNQGLDIITGNKTTTKRVPLELKILLLRPRKFKLVGVIILHHAIMIKK